MNVLTVVSFVLVSLGMVYAWWDIQRAKLHNDEHAQSMLRGEVNSLKLMDQELRRSILLLQQELAAGLKDLQGELDVDEKALRQALSEDPRFKDFADAIDQHTEELAWCKQNIRDLGKAPPVAQTRPRPMPFGQKRG